MKKVFLSTIAITNLSSSIPTTINYTTQIKQDLNIVKDIAQEFESNFNKKINYNNIFKSIYNNSSFFAELNKNINIFNGGELADKYGYPIELIITFLFIIILLIRLILISKKNNENHLLIYSVNK